MSAPTPALLFLIVALGASQALAQSPGASPGASSGQTGQPAPSAINPPGAYRFELRADTLEQRQEMLRRAEADPQRKKPTEVAPLEIQKIIPVSPPRR